MMGSELTQRELENIVAEHAGLVRSVALRLSHIYQAEAEDLMQIGYIGLMKAARRFEAGRGFAFSTYAVPMITGEIRSQMRDQGRIKVSRSLKADIAAVRRAENQFAAQYGASPRITELQKLTGFSAERITQALAAADTMNHPEVYEEQQLFCDEEMQHIMHIDLAAGLAALPTRQRQVILLRYYKDLTQQQAAQILRISQVQVSRIEKKALQALAQNMEADAGK